MTPQVRTDYEVIADALARAAQPNPAGFAQASPVVLITGSNRGIGLALTKAYATAGWRVIATCRDPSRASELRELAAGHPNEVVETLDVTSDPSITALAEKYRGNVIDVLVNNAGPPELRGAGARTVR